MKTISVFVMTEGDRLKEIRKFLGLTQRELSEALEIKQGSYSDVERGKAGISSLLLRNLIKKFRVNPLWLCDGEGKMFIGTNDNYIIETGKDDGEPVYVSKDSTSTKKNLVISEVESQIERMERQQQYIESLNSLIQNLKKEL
ncbi:MAG TPA: helix-turn-helix domain-containing protein [Tenuifilaceae bacterium]|nr:helix-turn-helix domain-containing protein [Tenuifilaceae bacterium]HPE17492.1 helix-turn-helix domain-containing protein [Tenuifilaceae bacterium]HPJ45138.1 helix-turn-helix domain-containing protein [Tenuifilaceae bacterium]HPQ33737.1 helix-turn-helix domain-containing protein [Tenuifilaceae bacterium]HRX67038.1 helix-turn-helix domain-containing protein [Tenuifilaceae bacterium]